VSIGANLSITAVEGHYQRFNNTLRQRLARLVRGTLSFSKKVENHIGAIKFFICHYNLEKAGALPV
jgi:insertion element IS1 protein InsB